MKLFAAVLFLAAALVACDIGPPATAPPSTGGGPQTRVVRLTLDPDTVAVGDTALVHVVITDSLDARFRYVWTMGNTLPINNRTDKARVRWVAPALDGAPGEVKSVAAGVYITNDIPGTRGLDYSFSIPVLTPLD